MLTDKQVEATLATIADLQARATDAEYWKDAWFKETQRLQARVNELEAQIAGADTVQVDVQVDVQVTAQDDAQKGNEA